MEDGPVADLAGEAQHRQDVVGAVRVVVDDAAPGEHVEEGVVAETAVGSLARIAPCGVDAASIGAGAVVEGAHEGGLAGAGAGEGRVSDGVGAVGHLHPAADVAHGIGAEEQVFHARGVATELEIQRLATHQVPRAGHRVDGRDAARARAVDRGRARVEGVEEPHVRVGRRRPVAAVAAADVRVRVDDAGEDDAPAHVDPLGARGNRHRARGADGHDPPALHDDDAIGDHGRRHRVDRRAGEGDGALLPLRRHGGSGHEQPGDGPRAQSGGGWTKSGGGEAHRRGRV